MLKRRVIKSRFAPSPTGKAHLGTLFSAFCVLEDAKCLGAQTLLRFENLDQNRCKLEFKEHILNCLQNLNFHFDSICEQSQELSEIFRFSKMNELISQKLLYKCFCSRKNIKSRSIKKSHYDGYCQKNMINNINEISSIEYGVRLKLKPKKISWHDDVLGNVISDPFLNFGDPLIIRKGGEFTYLFSVVCDDILQNITRIVRGKDILENTGVQNYIYELLSGNRVQDKLSFWHHPLIIDKTKGVKFSKSHRDLNWDKIKEAYKHNNDIKIFYSIISTIINDNTNNINIINKFKNKHQYSLNFNSQLKYYLIQDDNYM